MTQSPPSTVPCPARSDGVHQVFRDFEYEGSDRCEDCNILAQFAQPQRAVASSEAWD